MVDRKRTSTGMLDYLQVADELNVSEASVRRLVAAGRLATVAVTPSGRKRMITRQELDRFVESSTQLQAESHPDHASISEGRKQKMKRAGWSGERHL